MTPQSLTEDPVRAELVAAAQNYFLRFGFSRVSTDEIVRSLGRSKKTLYRHFDTKEALLYAVLARLDAALEGEVLAILARPSEPVQRLEQVLTAVAAQVARTAEVLTADLRAKAPELCQQVYTERRTALAELMARIVKEGSVAGALRGDLDPTAAMLMFLRAAEALAGGAGAESVSMLVRLTVDGLRSR